MPGREPIISTEKLGRSFKAVEAVKDLSLDVYPGEIFGLVGPDGAGKTTTIRLLAAILDPTSGRATVAGFDTLTDPEPIKRRIGYMAQRFNLYGDLTVRENLNFFADVFELKGQERARRIDRLMRFAKLTEFLDRRASHLSGGMQKKLALACTLIHTPEIILLDEPTTGVDPVSRREFWDILTELHLQGITLVISTPYMDEAERCARVGLLYRGRLVVCDAPANIRARAEGDLIALWSTDQRRARVLLDGLPGVLEVQIYGEQLRVFVDDASSMLDRVCTTLKEHGIEVHEAHETSPRMEDAFISLIRRQAMEGEAE